MDELEKAKVTDEMLERAVMAAAQAAPYVLERYFQLKDKELDIRREQQRLKHEENITRIHFGSY